MDFMPHPGIVTRKERTETAVAFISLENQHVPVKEHSQCSLMEYILAFEIFESYACLWFTKQFKSCYLSCLLSTK